MQGLNDSSITLEHRVILEMINPATTVLDIGCGDGALMALLMKEKKVDARGIEVDEQCIYSCVERGLSVYHNDIDSGLSEYGDLSFDYVILNQSLQQVRKPDIALKESLRVGKAAIIGIPNFACISARLQLFLWGRTPVTPSLPYRWWETPNLRFLTIADFIAYCQLRSFKIEHSVFIRNRRRIVLFPNLLADVGIFLLKNETKEA